MYCSVRLFTASGRRTLVSAVYGSASLTNDFRPTSQPRPGYFGATPPSEIRGALFSDSEIRICGPFLPLIISFTCSHQLNSVLLLLHSFHPPILSSTGLAITPSPSPHRQISRGHKLQVDDRHVCPEGKIALIPHSNPSTPWVFRPTTPQFQEHLTPLGKPVGLPWPGPSSLSSPL